MSAPSCAPKAPATRQRSSVGAEDLPVLRGASGRSCGLLGIRGALHRLGARALLAQLVQVLRAVARLGLPRGGSDPAGALPAAGKRLCARLLLAPVMTSPEEAPAARSSLRGLLLLLFAPSRSGPSASPRSGRLGRCCLPWHLREPNQPGKCHQPPVPKG